jgi:hypothetical protein
MKQVPLILLLLAMPSPVLADTITRHAGAATLTVRFDGKGELALSDLVRVTLEVVGGPELLVDAPLMLPDNAPWLLVERSGVTRTPHGDGVKWRLEYSFAPREPGELQFVYPAFRWREGKTEWQSATFDPIPIRVVTQIAKVDRTAARDITSIESIPDPGESAIDWRWLAALTGTVIALCAAWLVWRYARHRKERSLAHAALYEWRRLTALDLPRKGRSERFITLLTLLMRRYFERQFGIPARRQTTPEFLRDLSNHASLTDEERSFSVAFLQACEAVKFANVPMSEDECERWGDAARAFLERRASV